MYDILLNTMHINIFDIGKNFMTDFGSGFYNAMAFYQNGEEHLVVTNDDNLRFLDLGKTIDILSDALVFYDQYSLNLRHCFLCERWNQCGFLFVLRDYGVRNILGVYFKLEINGKPVDNIIYYQDTLYGPKNEIKLYAQHQIRDIHSVRPIIEQIVYYNSCYPNCRLLFGTQQFPQIAGEEEIAVMNRLDREYKRITDKKSNIAGASHKNAFWREGLYPSWKLYPEAVRLLCWVKSQTQKIEKILSKFHENLKDINLQPPKGENIIYIPIDCTCDKQYNIKMWLLRNHFIVTRIVSGYDMLQYQIPVSFNNIELIILVYGQHYQEPIYWNLKEVVGLDHSVNTYKQVKDACPILQLIKNTEEAVSDYYREDTIIKSDIYQKFLETKKELSQWIAKIYNQAYEEFINAKSIYVWKSEYRLFKYINLFYPGTVYQYHPDWLEGQSLDIFIPQENCAIEYQGEQHYQALDYFGGKKGYEYRQELDNVKKERCKQNGILLLEWIYSERICFSAVVDFLNKNLHDAQIDRNFFLESLKLNKPVLVAEEDSLFATQRVTEKKKKADEFEIRKYNSQGVLINCYASVEIASQDTAISKTQILKAIYGYNHTAGGFQWKKVKRNEEKSSIPPLAKPRQNSGENESKVVYQIDLNGTICAEFGSIRTAVRATGINRKSICDALRGRQKTAGGYIWKYKENEEGPESEIKGKNI